MRRKRPGLGGVDGIGRVDVGEVRPLVRREEGERYIVTAEDRYIKGCGRGGRHDRRGGGTIRMGDGGGRGVRTHKIIRAAIDTKIHEIN